MCTQAELKKITNEVTQGAKNILGNKLRKVILYGSYARGDYNADSDVDIMILADVGDEERYSYDKKMCEIESRLGLENNIMITAFIKNHNHFYEHIDVLPFYRNVVNDGVELYVNE